MEWFEWTLQTPAENLACDEALLELAEAAGGRRGWLRIWESQKYFVILGYGNKISAEADVEACRGLGIPILRRCSGGGTVLQGPGCVNYTLVLPVEEGGRTITAANSFIMEKQRRALGELLGKAVTVEGHTDLAIEGRKFSGNAQRRTRGHVLFHGTFLLEFDRRLIELVLRKPPREPEYRRGRGHLEFLKSIDVGREALHAALARVWNARVSKRPPMEKVINRLVGEKYGREEWNLKW